MAHTTAPVALRFLSPLVLFAALVACGGSTASPSGNTGNQGTDGDAGGARGNAGGDAGTTTGPSDAASADAPNVAVPDGGDLTCDQLAAAFGALPNTTADRACTTVADCVMVSADVCYDSLGLALNQAGAAAAKDIRQRYFTCRPDCGSGSGGSSFTLGCQQGLCVAIDEVGGTHP